MASLLKDSVKGRIRCKWLLALLQSCANSLDIFFGGCLVRSQYPDGREIVQHPLFAAWVESTSTMKDALSGCGYLQPVNSV